MYAEPKTTPPTVEEISAIAKGFSQIKFDERFLMDDFIVVTEVAAPPTPPQPAARQEKPITATTETASSAPAAPPPPPPPAVPSNPTARALYDFIADGSDKVSLTANQIYEVMDSSNDAWWLVLHNGQSGWAPGAYLQKL